MVKKIKFDNKIFFVLVVVVSGDPNFCLPISSSWVEIRLHTEDQPPRLSRSALKVSPGGGVVGGPTKYFATPHLS